MAPIAPAVPIPAPPPVAPLAQDAPAPAHPHAPPPAMPTPAPAMHAPPTAGAGADAGLSALLAGMGIAAPPALSADPAATLRAAGAALRAAISGLRALLIARADVKREFRIEATMLGTANNPVKFSHNDDAALLALLGAAGHGPASVQDAVNDLTAHQVATLAATQAAARALLERLAPAGVESADPGGSLFGASREKRLWEAYKKLHEQVGQQFEDDFDSAFGKAFARAYEQALRNGRG
jgi:type VI secretion system protein ImpI/type VI secretion system protein